MASTRRYTLYSVTRTAKSVQKTRIGALVARKDGDGFEVYFDAHPAGTRGLALAEAPKANK